MQIKTLPREILPIFILLGLIFSVIIFLYSSQKKTVNNESRLLIDNNFIFSEKEQEHYDLPVRLKIPKIDVDTLIEYIGLTLNGEMGVPKEISNTSWFNLGPRPGENGSAVIAGHYGFKDRKEAVFNNLYKLHKGDKLYIEDEKGTIITFVVREIRSYDPNEDASDVFSSMDEKAHLNLITCEGVWNEDSKTYSKRLVVFTDKEEINNIK